MKFKLTTGKGSVSQFYLNGVDYYPGDIVDLPSTYEGVAWLTRIDPVPVVVVPPQKIDPVVAEVEVAKTVEAEPVVATASVESTAANWGTSKKKTAATTT